MAAEAPARTLRDKIGGRWAVSWQGYLLLLPFAVVFVLTTVPGFQGATTLGLGIAASLVAYAATGAVLWIGSVTVLRHRRERPAPVSAVLVVGGLAWAVRSAVVAVALDAWGLESTTPLAGRLLFGFTLGAVAVSVTAWFLDNLEDFQNRRERALQRLVDQRVAADRQAAYVTAMREGLVGQVSAALDRARGAMDRLQATSESIPIDAVAAMERVSREGIRQVSHETWREGRAVASLSLGDVLRIAATTTPFRYWSLVLLVPFWVVVAARSVGWSLALLMGVVGAASLLVAITVANLAVPRSRWPMGAYALSVLALAGVGPIVIAVHAGIGTRGSVPAELEILASISVAFVIPATGLSRALEHAEGRSLEALDASISAAEIEREALAEQERRVRREIAIALHGTVGANLTAATMRLRKAIDSGDVEAATEALAESRRLLDVDLHALLLREHADVRTALAELVDQWCGLVEITVDVDGTLDVSPATVQALIDVVTEGISNSVGHGGATSIEIVVRDAGGHLRVVLEDDGCPLTRGAPGLGSRMLDQHARGLWTREAMGAQGTRMTIEVGS